MVCMPCYGMFFDFNPNDFGGQICGFTWDRVRACLRSCFGSKFGVPIATHMGFKTAALGCVAPAPL